MTIAISVIAAVLILLLIAAVAIACVTYRVTCLHTDADKIKNSDPHIEFGHKQYADLNPEIHRLIDLAEKETPEELTIRSSRDGTELFGRLYRFGDSDTVNIFFHGYRGSALRDGCGGFEMSKKMGINALFVDQRANGRSGGNVITFGILERFDAADWVEKCIEIFGKNVKIALSGVSLGAATVLMASGLDLPENVKCIIADCGFSSPKEIICKVASEQGYIAGICWPLLWIAARLHGHFDLNEETAVKAVSRTKIPILIIHGDDDRYVPFEMGEKIYAAAASEKQFLRIPGAPHAASYVVDKAPTPPPQRGSSGNIAGRKQALYQKQGSRR